MNHYFITGTSRGIGKALAELLLNDSRNVVYGFARNKSLTHDNYSHHSINLSDPRAVAEFQFPALNDVDKIVLINNAGTLGQVKYLGTLSSQDITDSYSVNIIAPAILMNNFIKFYADIPCEKVIVNITSGAAQNPYDGWSVYCSSKAAIDMLSKAAVIEQDLLKSKAPFDILAVAPGVVKTQMQQQIRESQVKDFSRKQKFVDLIKEGQLYEPEDVALALQKIINNPRSLSDTIHRIVL